MNRICISKDKDLTAKDLSKILKLHQTTVLPKLQEYKNYYDGKQPIFQKSYPDPSKPCNKIVTNYCYSIVHNYLGYIAGIPVTYDVDETLHEILNYNDVNQEDTNVLTDMLIYGKGYEINYVDEDKHQRFKTVDPRYTVVVYDDTLNQELLYGIRYYAKDSLADEKDQRYVIELYSSTNKSVYESNVDFDNITIIAPASPHFFNQVPFTVFSLNSEEESIFDKVMTLQDAYNNLLSGEVDDFEAFCDAYMVLTGCDADKEDIEEMKKNRVIILPDGATANYLNKIISDTQIENMLQNINDNIHKISNSPDFSDEKFMATSGIAMKFKLIGFENRSADIASNMEKALRRRLELISGIVSLVGGTTDWVNCSITFTRNLPQNELETVQVINQLRGLVSDTTLLSRIPFIDNPADELDKANVEKQVKVNLYSFGSTETKTGVDG